MRNEGCLVVYGKNEGFTGKMGVLVEKWRIFRKMGFSWDFGHEMRKK